MADSDVKITIGADDSELKKKLDETEEGLESLGDKQKETQDETQKTTTKFEELANAIDKQEKELKALKGEYIETAINLGENSKEAQTLKEKFSTLNAELKENKQKFQSVSDSLEDLEESSKKSGKGFDFANIAIGNFISDGIQNFIGKVGEAISSLVALADETRKYREDMAKLDTAFTSAGHSKETAKKAYDDFYKILGESDRSVEAVNHLAELTKNTEEVAKWSTIASGVTAKFGDSLPIEGLTEAANETAKVGQVTGPLADALNWAGISEDKFNEQLKKCNSEQARATLITNTLSKEYEAAAAEYNTLTASTQAARDATNKMEQAQARLGAAVEPFTTMVTTAKTAFFDFAATLAEDVALGIEKTKELTTGLNAEQRALIDNAYKAAEAFRGMREASAENSGAINSQFDYTQKLADELFRLADANGFVEDEERGRVEFILGELSSALGTEYTLVGNQIQQYKGLRDAINETIAAERARLLLAEYQDDYVEAVKVSAEQEAAINAQREAMYKTLSEVEDARSKEKIKRIEYEQAKEAGASFHYLQQLGSELTALETNTRNKELLLDKQQKKLTDLEKTHGESANTINAYESAKAEILAGNTDKAIKILNNYDAELKGSTDNTISEYDKQLNAARSNVVDTSVQLALLEEEYAEKHKGMTDAQKAEMEKRIEAAKKEAQDARTEYKSVGGDMVEGLVEGVSDKDGNPTWSLAGKMKSLVERAVKAAKEAAKIKSPSRVFRDEVGAMISAGIAVGIEKNADEVIDASKGLIQALKKEIENDQKTIVDNIKDYNTEIADLEKEKNEKLAELEEKFIADKKKKGADKKALEKQYAKDIENINEQHADKLASIQDNIKKTITGRMQEIVSLGDTYKDNVKKIWEDLDKSITDLQANYDNQLASRTESIANSLNLWNEASKNSVTGNVLQKNLQSQVRVLEDYNEAIAKLEERNVSTAFINSLKEMGVGATGELEALVKMSDTQLNTYVELWEKKNELAKNAAIEELEPLKAETEAKIEELTNAALDKYSTLRAEYMEQGALLMAELKQAMIDAGQGGYEEIIGQIDEYTAAGEDLMDGVITGIVDKSPAMAEAVTRAVERSIRAAKAAAGIASPSKVMKKEVGYNLADGVSVGWSDKIADLKNQMAVDMQGITARIKTAVSLENAKMAVGVGVRDTGFTEVAQAVGMQTAGINSLASEYRKGSSSQVTVPLILNGRELGRAIVDLGSEENARIGTNLVFA